MALQNDIPSVRKGDWTRLKITIDKLRHIALGAGTSPTFAGLTLTGLTASTLIGANASKALESITVGTGLDYTRPNLTLSHLGIEALTDPGADKILFWDDTASACKWLGMGNSVAITDVTLDTIQDIRTTATPTFDDLTISTPVNIYALSHDSFADYDANKHIDHTGVTLTAGTGLTGGGDISVNRTFAVDGVLEDLDTLGVNTFTGDPVNDFLVGTAAGTLVWQYGATARTSIGLGTADNPTFAALTVTTINGLGVKYTATGNIAIGDSTTLDALDADPTHNIAIGNGAGSGVTDGDNNIFIGYRAGYTTTIAGSCIAIGYEALYGGTSRSSTVAIGYQAMRYHNGGNGNTVIGHQAGLGDAGGAAYTYNVFIGEGAGTFCNDGGSNVIVGRQAGHHINDGTNNIFIGQMAGHTQVDNSNLLIIDNQERANVATDITNAILYGVMAAAPASQTLRINAVTTVSQTLTGLSTATFEGASVTVGKASTTTGTLILHDSGSANTITLTVPNALAGSLSFTLPPTDGDNTDVLQTNGSGVLTWVPPASGAFSSRVYASLSSSQTIEGAWEKVLFDSEVFDGDSEYDNSSNYRFTATNTGYYWVGVALRYSPGISGKAFQAAVKKNGTDYILSSQTHMSSTSPCQTICFGVVYLAATDYIEVETAHNFGVDGTLLGHATRPTYVAIHRLS